MSYQSLASIRIAEFDRKHGGNPVFHGNWYWYLDGASREGDPLGALCEPPEDDFARLSNVVQYYAGHLAHAVNRFDAQKERMMMFTSADREAISELKRLQLEVQKCSAALERTKSKLGETAVAKMRAGARQADAERKAEQVNWRAEVSSITV